MACRSTYNFLLFFLLMFTLIDNYQLLGQDTTESFTCTCRVRLADELTPATGATVRIKGTNEGGIINADGEAKIAASKDDTLVFSFVGYEKLEMPVRSRSILQIELTPSISKLQEVQIVAVGYGELDQRKVIGAVSTLKAEEMDKGTVSFDNAIIGKIPGVQVSSTSGQPGSATAITIRGLSTLNPDANNPLIVIDGVPVYGSGGGLNTNNFQDRRTLQGFAFGNVSVSDPLNNPPEFERNPLADLNPDDIKSIEVLKDAFATSIYGSRGAAGVILVTTKRGKEGDGRINLNYRIGVGQAIGMPDLLNGKEYADFYTRYSEEILGFGRQFDTLTSTDWLDKVVRTFISQDLNLSFSGGGDKSRYYSSVSYLKQPSYIINNDFERYTARLNYTYSPQKIVTLGSNFSVSYTNNEALNSQSIYRNAILKAPNVPVRDREANYIWDYGDNPYGKQDVNPVAIAETHINYIKNFRTIGNLFVEVNPFDWLKIKSQGGIDLMMNKAYSRERERPRLIGGSAVESNDLNIKWVINNTLTANKTIGLHDFNVVLGNSFETSNESATRITGAGFFNDDLLSIQASEDAQVSEAITHKWALVSYFGRINYSYDHKYLAGVSYRLDGSSRFAKNHQYIGFPSFALGWRLSKENFMNDLDFVNELKLRSSIGFSGIAGSGGYYGFQGQYRIVGHDLTYGDLRSLEMVQPANPNLTWERTRTLDIGIDLGLLNGALQVTADYYHKKTTDFLFNSALPLYKGFSIQKQNIGDMLNQGVEIGITSFYDLGDFTWNGSFNIAANRNKILKLNFDGESTNGADLNYKYFKEDEAAGQYFLYEWMGVDPETGNPLWVDGNGEITMTPPASDFVNANASRRPFGTSFPDYFGGFNNTFTYKNWKLNVFFSYSLGGQLYNGARATMLTYSTPEANNLSREILMEWKDEGDITGIPKLLNRSVVTSNASSLSDYTASRTISRFLEDNSYARLKTLSLSYSLPQKLLNRLGGIKQARIFVEASNIWTLTKYSGIDPEVTIGGSSALLNGYDELTLPQNKMISAGLNLTL